MRRSGTLGASANAACGAHDGGGAIMSKEGKRIYHPVDTFVAISQAINQRLGDKFINPSLGLFWTCPKSHLTYTLNPKSHNPLQNELEK